MEKKKNQTKLKKINPNQKAKTSRPKNKITTSKPKNTPENRLSDLENTLDLNIQILKTFYQSSKPVQSILTNENIINSIDNVKKKYLKKKELFKLLKEKKSKSLIELQIYAEKKRR